MTAGEFIAAAFLKATGSISTLTPADDDWSKLLQLGNFYQNTWANEFGVDWASLYDPAVNCGTVTATDTFDLDESIHKISQNDDDHIRILYAGSVTRHSDYTLISPDRLKYFDSGNYVAKVGSKLKFTRTFSSTDAQFGGTILVPAYTIPEDLTGGSDDIAVDNPNWLVTVCAAEYVRNDLVRQGQYGNLIAEANELMKKMVENNNPQQDKVVMRQAAIGRTW